MSTTEKDGLESMDIGRVLKDITARLCLQQVVKEPTRKNNMLDLIFSNLPAADASVHGSISKSGHRTVFVETKPCLHIEDTLYHVVWHYHYATSETDQGTQNWAFHKVLWAIISSSRIVFNHNR